MNLKHPICAVFLILASNNARTQQPVNWSFNAMKISDKKYEIHVTPHVKSPWHIYSQTSPEGGGAPTVIKFRKHPLVIMEGKTQEIGKTVSKYEEVFDVTVKYFPGQVDFVQVVKLKKNLKTKINGTVEFMACTDKECLPPEVVHFEVPLQ